MRSQEESISENEIRDLLIKDLSIIESGLRYMAHEHSVAGEGGSGGRIDILAKDKYDHTVIIEIKRSEAAARQALHEITKYLQIGKLKPDECRVLVVSTSWSELSSSLALYQEKIDHPVEPYFLSVVNGRLRVERQHIEKPKVHELAYHKEHLQLVYDNAEDASKAFHSLKSLMDRYSVPVVVVFLQNPNAREEVQARVYLISTSGWDSATKYNAQVLIEETGVTQGRDPVDGPYNIYEDYLYALAKPFGPSCLERDRGAPQKLANYECLFKVADHHFSKEFVRRFPLHDIIDLINLACNRKAGAKTTLKTQFSSRHVASFEKGLNAIREFLRHRPNWVEVIEGKIEEKFKELGSIEVDIEIHDRRNVIGSMVDFHRNQDGRELPHYSMLINNAAGEVVLDLYGTFFWNGEVMVKSPQEYFAELGASYITGFVGGCSSRDSQICTRLGLFPVSVQSAPELMIYLHSDLLPFEGKDFSHFYEAHVGWIGDIAREVIFY